MHRAEVPQVKRQVIDIQLTSLSDFANHKEWLPATKPGETLKKRNTTAELTRTGSLTSYSSAALDKNTAHLPETQAKKIIRTGIDFVANRDH